MEMPRNIVTNDHMYSDYHGLFEGVFSIFEGYAGEFSDKDEETHSYITVFTFKMFLIQLLDNLVCAYFLTRGPLCTEHWSSDQLFILTLHTSKNSRTKTTFVDHWVCADKAPVNEK